jgi:hypothetical protein
MITSLFKAGHPDNAYHLQVLDPDCMYEHYIQIDNIMDMVMDDTIKEAGYDYTVSEYVATHMFVNINIYGQDIIQMLLHGMFRVDTTHNIADIFNRSKELTKMRSLL